MAGRLKQRKKEQTQSDTQADQTHKKKHAHELVAKRLHFRFKYESDTFFKNNHRMEAWYHPLDLTHQKIVMIFSIPSFPYHSAVWKI